MALRLQQKSQPRNSPAEIFRVTCVERMRTFGLWGTWGHKKFPPIRGENSREAKTMRNQDVDWLVDAAPIEPVSGSKFPDNPGKCREFFAMNREFASARSKHSR